MFPSLGGHSQAVKICKITISKTKIATAAVNCYSDANFIYFNDLRTTTSWSKSVSAHIYNIVKLVALIVTNVL